MEANAGDTASHFTTTARWSRCISTCTREQSVSQRTARIWAWHSAASTISTNSCIRWLVQRRPRQNSRSADACVAICHCKSCVIWQSQKVWSTSIRLWTGYPCPWPWRTASQISSECGQLTCDVSFDLMRPVDTYHRLFSTVFTSDEVFWC